MPIVVGLPTKLEYNSFNSSSAVSNSVSSFLLNSSYLFSSASTFSLGVTVVVDLETISEYNASAKK